MTSDKSCCADSDSATSVEHSFPDLRADYSPVEDTQESFWPSFADIMMVVVMIFLISTAFLIIRNWGLTQELTQTIESEQQATQQVQTTLEENLTLEERLAALENLLSVSQLQNMRTEDEKEKVVEELKTLVEQLTRSSDVAATLETRLEDKTKEIQALISKLDLLDKEFKQAQQEVIGKNEKIIAQEKDLASSRKAIVSLEAARDQRNKAVDQAQSQIVLSEESLALLREEYVELQSKYDKLVRPARTTKGKYVVSLRYQRNNGADVIELKTPKNNAFENHSLKQLHEILAGLKEKYGEALYIRIIFPDNNKLTYKEAWGFTNDILNQYDYYYQKR